MCERSLRLLDSTKSGRQGVNDTSGPASKRLSRNKRPPDGMKIGHQLRKLGNEEVQ